jgi:hypothetical protein
VNTSVADPDPGSGVFVTPGSDIGKKNKIRIRDEHPGSSFRELRNIFLVKNLKYLNSLMWIRIQDPESFRSWIRDPGWKISDPG